uniref:Sphingomyelin phosphodiesterase C-terminal domain-containing protein n=1 Tax=Denticeps clupeoides TaxID=299321 RepID=A0AAY4CXD5_9TELE
MIKSTSLLVCAYSHKVSHGAVDCFCTHLLFTIHCFWHISDLHWDYTYKLGDDPSLVCSSSGRRPAEGAGKFGHYVCDSPWELINSSIYAMKNILEHPDFIVWTGDDTPHVPNEDLGEEKVLFIIEGLTQIIKQLFPSGYYTERLLNRPGFRVLVLNTNLYYDQNSVTENMQDPANQLQWMDDVLSKGIHLHPRQLNKAWFRPHFNKRYLELIQKHHCVIMGQFFGHHHTDSFRMFYSDENPVSTIFLTPGVTPWKTTLPGVDDGANNPGIRIFEYDSETLLVKDMITFYFNLTHANNARARWEKEYRLTEAFHVPDASPASMHRIMENMAGDSCILQKYYEFNSVSYDRKPCNAGCRINHICAIREVDFEMYKHCVETGDTSPTVEGAIWLLVLSAVSEIVIPSL